MRVLEFLTWLIPLFGLPFKKSEQIGYTINLSVQISYFDHNDRDLLDPANKGSIKESDIEIYYLDKGKKLRVYQPNLDLPKGFRIDKHLDGKYYLGLRVSNIQNTKGISQTFIEVKNRQVDTLITRLFKSKSNLRINKAWYNGILKWNGKGAPSFNVDK
jgi:hypothetical protein